jgi:5-(carboxyamino)imidazole ribonucleotide synthase
VIHPPAMLGILGGGQLGRFFVIAAQKMGYQVTVLDPDKKSPAGKIAQNHICKPYNDFDAINELKNLCDAVTTEFENIPSSTLELLEKDIVVCPGSKAVSIVQNRIKEKSFLRSKGIPVGKFEIVEDLDLAESLLDSKDIFPAIIKTAQFGYDGKGQLFVNNVEDVKSAFKKFDSIPCILEKKLNLDLEFSIVLTRSIDGLFEIYPLIENRHIDGILDISIIPAKINNSIELKAKSFAKKIANDLGYVGVMAVEFFVCSNNIYVNEIAPRPHNSGHFSIDASIHSQFQNQVFALTGNKLGETITDKKSVMLNLLGDIWLRRGEKNEPRFDLIQQENVNIHLYEKEEPRTGRKMGHITILGDNLIQLLEKTELIRKVLWEN